MRKLLCTLILLVGLFAATAGARTFEQSAHMSPNDLFHQMSVSSQGNAAMIGFPQGDGRLLAAGGYSFFDDFPSDLIYTKLSISDVYRFNCEQLRLLRNAIFAYHGYIFKSDDLRWYFNQFRWYNPRYKSDVKVMQLMTNTEKHNIEILKRRENQLGC